MPADRPHLAAQARYARLRFVFPRADPSRCFFDGGSSSGCVMIVDGDAVARLALEVVDVSAPDVEAFATPGCRVDPELQRVVVRLSGGGGLVVDDGERGRDPALFVQDDVGAPTDGHP